MTNGEKAEIAALAACALHGLLVRRSASSARMKVKWGLKDIREVETEIREWLDGHTEHQPLKTHMTSRNLQPMGLVDMARATLAGRSRRQNVLESEMGLASGTLDGVLTAENGFETNAQGWVRVSEAVTV